MGENAKAGKTLKRHTILVVDDDQTVLDVLQRLLSNLPHNLVLTTSPAEALEILRGTEVAVFLCDMAMPRIHGTVVLAEARKAQPNIVSILVSGHADRDAAIRAINEGGVWKFVLKPWEAQELLEIVKEAIARF